MARNLAGTDLLIELRGGAEDRGTVVDVLDRIKQAIRALHNSDAGCCTHPDEARDAAQRLEPLRDDLEWYCQQTQEEE